MKSTNTTDPDYFHKVVDCQWACPAHTPVPEYIRLIAARRYTDAYMLNWHSNVFPGILGRTCDRPCEPACRRVRTEEQPVAICRLKRVAADYKDDIGARLPPLAAHKNGKRIALVGAGPASLTVARDLQTLGYELVMFDREAKGGGMMRSQIPAFRLPQRIIDEEVDLILERGIDYRFGQEITSMQALLDEGYDAVFVGTGAPRGRDLDIPGRHDAAAHISIGIAWLASVAFGHSKRIGRRVLVIGGGNTAMDCCRTARRLGGRDVKVVVRSSFDEMKASPWEKEDAVREDIPIINNHVPKAFVVENGALQGMLFEKVDWIKDGDGRPAAVPTGEAPVFFPCDHVLLAIGQENSFPWIERDIGIDFKGGMPVVDPLSLQSTHPKVFFGGDAARGPKNIIWAVAHGHEAAISIDLLCRAEDVRKRPARGVNLVSQKMGMHEWSYDNEHSPAQRFPVPHADKFKTLKNIKIEVELGFDETLAYREAERCLNCDIQTVFTARLCIECDACVDICPMDCITFTENGPEEDIRTRLRATSDNLNQALYVSDPLTTGRIMVKDEDVCVHCGLCAERCPTGAWDMQKSLIHIPQAGAHTRSRAP